MTYSVFGGTLNLALSIYLALQTVNLVFILSEFAIANSFVRQGQDIGHEPVKKSVTVFPKRLRA